MGSYNDCQNYSALTTWLLNMVHIACRWVNEGTALAVFTDPAAAQAALQIPKSRYSLRPFSEVPPQLSSACLGALIPYPAKQPATGSWIACLQGARKLWLAHSGIRVCTCLPERRALTSVVAGQACGASREMPVGELQPPRPRPKTSAAVAKRLIGMALNDRSLRDKVGSLMRVP